MLDTLFPVMQQALADKPKIANQICMAINYLAIAMTPVEGQNSTPLSQYFDALLKSLVETAYRPDALSTDHKLALAAFTALNAVIERCAPDVLHSLNSVLPHIVGLLENTLKPEFPLAGRNDYQVYICGTLQVCMLRLSHYTLDEGISSKIIDLVIECFKAKESVFEEGLLLISSIATGNLNPLTLRIWRGLRKIHGKSRNLYRIRTQTSC